MATLEEDVTAVVNISEAIIAYATELRAENATLTQVVSDLNAALAQQTQQIADLQFAQSVTSDAVDTTAAQAALESVVANVQAVIPVPVVPVPVPDVQPVTAPVLFTHAGDPSLVDTTVWATATVTTDGGVALYTYVGPAGATVDQTVWAIYSGATIPAPV